MAPPAAITVDSLVDVESVTATKPLTVDGVLDRRAKAVPISSGIAPFASSDLFKGPVNKDKPLAKRWDHRISPESKSRQPSILKASAKYLAKPGIISLGGGLPSPSYFPFEHIDVNVSAPPKYVDGKVHVEPNEVLSIGKYDIVEGKSEYDLSVALNYGQSMGSPQLLRFVTEHTEIVHNPPYQDWQCSLTVGSTSALDMALRLFCSRGDYVIVGNYSFSSALESMRPMGLHVVGIAMDSEGIIPSALDAVLSSWNPAERHGADKPFVLYTVPSGQNPTGATQSLARRKAVYAVAQKHDLYIFEDEPYYFLQMQPYTDADAEAVPPPKSHDEFLKSLIPSYLSLDVDGRVMRMDSFSKVVSPGSRTGWITASAQICERVCRFYEVSTQSPSGLSQIMLWKLLDRQWGHAGYLDWLIHLRLEYTRRRDCLVRACEKYLPRAIVSWTPPAAGMFLWIQIDAATHPAHGKVGILEIEDQLFNLAVDHGALLSKGSWFLSDKTTTPDPNLIFFRATFAAAAEDKVQEAIKRFGDALKESFGISE